MPSITDSIAQLERLYIRIAKKLLETEVSRLDLSDEVSMTRISEALPRKTEDVKQRISEIFAKRNQAFFNHYLLQLLRNIFCLVGQNISLEMMQRFGSDVMDNLYMYDFHTALTTLTISASEFLNYNIVSQTQLLSSPDAVKTLINELGISLREVLQLHYDIIQRPEAIKALIRELSIPISTLNNLEDWLRAPVLHHYKDVITLVKEKGILLDQILRFKNCAILLYGFGEFTDKDLNQKAEIIHSAVAQQRIDQMIQMDSEDKLYSAIRDLWKKTRNDNVSSAGGFFHGLSAAEETYRKIQGIFKDKKLPSRERALSVLSLMHQFVTDPKNQNRPFTRELNNTFRLSEIKTEDVLKARAAEVGALKETPRARIEK